MTEGVPLSSHKYHATIHSRDPATSTHRGRDKMDAIFAEDIFKCIFLNGTIWISIKISLKFVPKASINNIPALVRIMAWCRPGNKPLSEPKMVRLPTHICITRPTWVTSSFAVFSRVGFIHKPTKPLIGWLNAAKIQVRKLPFANCDFIWEFILVNLSHRNLLNIIPVLAWTPSVNRPYDTKL